MRNISSDSRTEYDETALSQDSVDYQMYVMSAADPLAFWNWYVVGRRGGWISSMSPTRWIKHPPEGATLMAARVEEVAAMVETLTAALNKTARSVKYASLLQEYGFTDHDSFGLVLVHCEIGTWSGDLKVFCTSVLKNAPKDVVSGLLVAALFAVPGSIQNKVSPKGVDLVVCQFDPKGVKADVTYVENPKTSTNDVIKMLNQTKLPHIVGFTQPGSGATVWFCPSNQGGVQPPQSEKERSHQLEANIKKIKAESPFKPKPSRE